MFSAICGAGALPHEGKATRYTRQLQSVRRSEANHQCPDVAQGCRLWALQQVVLLTPCDQAIAYGKPFDRCLLATLGSGSSCCGRRPSPQSAVPSLIAVNPAADVKQAKLPKTKGHHSWTDEEIQQYRDYWKVGTQTAVGRVRA